MTFFLLMHSHFSVLQLREIASFKFEMFERFGNWVYVNCQKISNIFDGTWPYFVSKKYATNKLINGIASLRHLHGTFEQLMNLELMNSQEWTATACFQVFAFLSFHVEK